MDTANVLDRATDVNRDYSSKAREGNEEESLPARLRSCKSFRTSREGHEGTKGRRDGTSAVLSHL